MREENDALVCSVAAIHLFISPSCIQRVFAGHVLSAGAMLGSAVLNQAAKGLAPLSLQSSSGGEWYPGKYVDNWMVGH